jgi:cytochrome b561
MYMPSVTPKQGMSPMSARSSLDRYGSVAIAIHWLTAVAIVALLGLGLAAANNADPEVKAALLRAHVPLGILVLLLTVFRILWWFIDRRPAPLRDTPRWQVSAESAVRVLIYAAVLILGFSGIALLALSGAGGVLFFHAQEPLPDFWHFPPMFAHYAAALLLIALVCGHIAAALYHQFFKRDRLLHRMGIGSAPSLR